MTVETSPTWDPTETLRVRVDSERRELVVTAGGERIAFALRGDRPDRLGWVRLTPPRRRVAVGDVVAHCLRQWDAEQEVLAISIRAAEQASRRGGSWRPAAKRLRAQVCSARRSRRLAVLPFQVLWRELADSDARRARRHDPARAPARPQAVPRRARAPQPQQQDQLRHRGGALPGARPRPRRARAVSARAEGSRPWPNW
jgi:hypothetical protein